MASDLHDELVWPEPLRRSRFAISLRQLATLLDAPVDVEPLSVHVDPRTDVVTLVYTHPDLRETAPGCEYPATMTRVTSEQHDCGHDVVTIEWDMPTEESADG